MCNGHLPSAAEGFAGDADGWGALAALEFVVVDEFEDALDKGAVEAGGGALDETGKRFHREILSVGGSRPALESFKAFRGREPQIDALLRHNGMEPA